MTAAVSAPTAAPSNPDPKTGYAVLQQPIALTATSPVLASGASLMTQGSTGAYEVDPATAKSGYLYGALLYRNNAGAVDIFDGANWIPESSFDPSSATLKPARYAFDQKKNQWSTTFVLSTLPQAGSSSFLTASSGSPKYGFISLFTTPKASPTTAIRSALGSAFGVVGSSSATVVQPGLLQGLEPTQDAKSADGFTVLVVEPSQLPAAQLIVSGSMGATGHQIALQIFAGGIARASILLAPSGDVTVTSATQVTIDAPVVNVLGTLYAQNVSYVPYGGSTSVFL